MPPPSVVSPRRITRSPRHGDDRAVQPELGEAVSDARDPGRDVRSPEVNVDARVVANRDELVEEDVEAIRGRIGVGRDERLSSRDLVPLDARKADGDALPGVGSLDVAVVHLHASRPYVATRRLESEPVSGRDRARPERAGHDCSEARYRDRAVDVETRRRVGAGVHDVVGEPAELRAEVVQALARPGADADDCRLGSELARLLLGKIGGRGVDRIDLRQRYHTAVDPEQPEDREVLVRLRACALAGVDHEQEEIDARRPRDHRADEALVARDVDHRQPSTVGELERRVPEVDRDAAPPLLRQPVRVLPRQRANEPRLPVVDVPRGADRQRHQRRLTRIRHGFCSQSSWSSSSGTKPRAA